MRLGGFFVLFQASSWKWNVELSQSKNRLPRDLKPRPYVSLRIEKCASLNSKF